MDPLVVGAVVGAAVVSRYLYSYFTSAPYQCGGRLPDDGPVPAPIQSLFAHFSALQDEALCEEGIFRTVGSMSRVNELRQQLDSGKEVDFSGEELSTVTSLLKMYLRTMDEPLFPFNTFDILMSISSCKEEEWVDRAKEVYVQIPECRKQISHHLFMLLSRVSSLSARNMMTASNLAIVFSPILLQEQDCSAESMLQAIPRCKITLERMIRYCNRVLPQEPPSNTAVESTE